MEQISTIRALVGLWPSRAEFADDAGAPVSRVHKWVTANAIPAKHHLAIIEAGRGRGLPVSADLMVALHARTGSEAA
jgi:hypothetical protein